VRVRVLAQQLRSCCSIQMRSQMQLQLWMRAEALSLPMADGSRATAEAPLWPSPTQRPEAEEAARSRAQHACAVRHAIHAVRTAAVHRVSMLRTAPVRVAKRTATLTAAIATAAIGSAGDLLQRCRSLHCCRSRMLLSCRHGASSTDSNDCRASRR
jgi:hypothetical protein